MKRKKYDLSTPAGRAMELLHDPKWSWNKFPRHQLNWIAYNTQRYVGLDLYYIARSTRYFFTGTYSNTIKEYNWPRRINGRIRK